MTEGREGVVCGGLSVRVMELPRKASAFDGTCSLEKGTERDKGQPR